MKSQTKIEAPKNRSPFRILVQTMHRLRIDSQDRNYERVESGGERNFFECRIDS